MKIFNKFGKNTHRGLWIIVAIFAFFQMLQLYDAFYYQFLPIPFLAFVMGLLFTVKRFWLKALVLVFCLLIWLYAGQWENAQQIYLWLPLFIGLNARWMVVIVINLVEKYPASEE